MHNLVSIRFVLILAMGMFAGSHTHASNYRFDDLYVASSGRHPPSINNYGEVAYRFNSGGIEQIRSGSGGPFTVIAEQGMSIGTDSYAIGCSGGPCSRTFGDFPVISDNGVVAFKSFLTSGEQGIFAGNGLMTHVIATTAGIIRPNLVGDFGLHDINREDRVVFRAGLDAGGAGLFVGDGATLEQFPRADSNPDINDQGVIAYGQGGDAFIRSVDGTTKQVTDIGFFVLTYLDINNQGNVALNGIKLRDPGSGVFSFAAAVIGGEVKPLDGLNEFEYIESVMINESNQISYVGRDESLMSIGILKDDVPEAVVAIGQELFGSSLESLATSPKGFFNDRGQIAFQYRLFNGRSGIAVATPVPEPSSSLLAIVGFTLLLSRKAKHVCPFGP
jgi:hypothetical protein